MDYFSEVFVTTRKSFEFRLGSLASSNKIAPLGERRGMERVTHRTPTHFSLTR
jgi:hypothetical protein